ncbi:hypothetical protein ABB37_07231 [Leptomonas pyrrhocoris]|uniref:Dynein light intermediate chain n=1 Tax=Leptomonas pyrrhocoris TaxID=157538 RepID=A0A0M9FWJ5_LEPPY|nr:hypothetical protein ABB37_07231 [Leptomonas pyrrhocoris]XP_015655794.1 hypothetical protein ABB37_07231 [Leptomonas pyrrhocoris]XP_015655795.1 hypothetical protein ABB37_07231 [Leptomonas pyrrhocoris]KPA77354.1 hypothetical protein ABB37_07231 [Leptomonas pyrrhocoris]KPA77355.1 hypothetical protein ABB37_07231 [Leptomonas pyrrhocoris]KPA77356.1 hypothetical protein ABB37_07231 [Leptomonas pyrrhocoris]|eukprot:XP_015655793.1 hypothetical protein ABB37_07231 [Leptomonas pyrrhocoris]
MSATDRPADGVTPLAKADLSATADTDAPVVLPPPPVQQPPEPPQAPQAPQASASPSSAAAAASPPSDKDAEAVAMDPAALWAALDLPAPEAMPSQHTARRVVLLGRPLSGKRTVCRRLCFAAEAQYAAPDDGDDGDRSGNMADNGRQPLYHPSSSDEEDADLFPSQNLGGWNMPGAFSTVGALQERTVVGPHDHSGPLSHGSGVCFDYVVQRVPTRIAHGGEESANASSAARRVESGGGGTVRRTTEFFCCDSAGALSMALPSIEDVETAVVLMVVDVSDVATIRQQLDFCYTTLNSYVATLLRNQAPNNDEVRRLQLATALQDYWFAEEQKLRTTRTNLASSVSASKEGKSDVLFKDPMVSVAKVNATVFRVPASAGTVCAMHTVVVCTKAEHLERASRAVGILDGAGGSGDNDALFARLGVSAELVAALRRSRLSLMALLSQIIRQYAVYRRAAVASLSQRVNMTTAGADGEYAGSALVNPFYRGFWSYISYVLYSGKDANSAPSSDVLRVCSARMHPYALLPCGLDAPGLLNHFITSDPTQFADLANGASDEAADSAIRTTAEGVLTPDGVFALHQKYIQRAQAELSASWAHADMTVPHVEETNMIWDSL